MKSFGWIAAALLLAACHPPPASGPDATYRDFVKAVNEAHKGSEVKLLDFFDASTRVALQARAKAASEATGKNMPDDAEYQLVLGAANVPALAEVTVVQSSGDAATLQVTTDGGGQGQVKMVREQGQWRIHLDALPSSSPDGG